MKKISSLFLLYFFLAKAVLCQSTPRQWILGQGNGGPAINNIISFSDTGTFVQGLPNTHNNLSVINASIADANHPFLFYSNGVNIYNWQHNIILDGDSLNPCPYTFNNLTIVGYGLAQMDAFIPDPGDTNRFYLFHASGDLYYDSYPNFSGADIPNKLYYTIVDKTLDNGNGGVISKNNIVGSDTIGNGLLAVKHGNGRDWWIITRHNHRSKFFTWLVTPLGVNGPFIQQTGPKAFNGFVNFKFNYLTNQVIGYRNWHTNDSMYIDIYDFNRCTGIFNFSSTLPISYKQHFSGPGGCEISPSGRYLYAGTMLELHQYDMLAANIATSDILIDDMPLDTAQIYGCPYGAMQLGPDGKIYIGTNYGSDFHLNVINNPDSGGLVCNAARHQITFPAAHFQDLPNIPLYDLGPLYGSPCDSLSAGINDLTIQTQFFIYPNPATDKVNVICTNYVKGTDDVIEIYTVTGKLINSIPMKGANTSVDVSALNNGTYIIKIKLQNSVLQQKLEIIK